MRRPAKDGSLLLSLPRRLQLVALRFHAELREAVLFQELVAVRIDERARRPDHLAGPDNHRLHAVLIPVAVVARLSRRGQAAWLLVAAHLVHAVIARQP